MKTTATRTLDIVSAFAFPIAGFASFSVEPSMAGVVFFAAMMFLGFASAYDHWHKTPFSGDLDHAAMLGVFSVLAVQSVGGPWWLMAIVGGAFGFALPYPRQIDFMEVRHILGVLILWILIGTSVTGGNPWIFIGSVALLAASFYLRFWKRFTIWGHATFHVLAAIGLAGLDQAMKV